MGFFTVLFKIVAVLLGLPLTLGGFFGFWYGLYVIILEQNYSMGIMTTIGCVVALTLGTILGKYARGDYN
jgi:hypothetical protein